MAKVGFEPKVTDAALRPYVKVRRNADLAETAVFGRRSSLSLLRGVEFPYVADHTQRNHYPEVLSWYFSSAVLLAHLIREIDSCIIASVNLLQIHFWILL